MTCDSSIKCLSANKLWFKSLISASMDTPWLKFDLTDAPRSIPPACSQSNADQKVRATQSCFRRMALFRNNFKNFLKNGNLWCLADPSPRHTQPQQVGPRTTECAPAWRLSLVCYESNSKSLLALTWQHLACSSWPLKEVKWGICPTKRTKETAFLLIKSN